MWDPGTYLRFDAERSRPFQELTARIGAERPRAVVDLGCGPGTLTRALADRWPDARISGVDAAPEMIARAIDPPPDRIRFTVGDVRDWRPGPDDDVVVCNAVLQWVPGHEELLTAWAGALPPGAWLAVQVPGNFDAPSHRALRAVATDPRWRDRLAHLARTDPVRDAVGYTALLAGAGCQVDAWETSYVHVLPVADPGTHPVLSWMEGTALRPYRAVLAAPAGDRDAPAGAGGAPAGHDDPWSAFRDALAERLAVAYPVRNGAVHFPFRRIFFVARTP